MLLGCVLGMPALAWAIGGKDQVARKGQPTREVEGWPKGVLGLINHPLRASGWHPWFSGCPNDSHYYEFDVRDPDDVNDLIRRLGAIQAKTLRVHLDPAQGAAHANGVGAIFGLGNQPVLDQWYGRIREIEPGVRVFGVHRYRAVPEAQPPTPTLYVGHEAVNMAKLTIPVDIEVTTATAAALRHKEPEAYKAIDACIKAHAQRRRQIIPKDLHALWTDLSRDAEQGARVYRTLVAAPTVSIPFLSDRLQPVKSVDAKQVAELVTELDSSRFEARDRAARALEELGPGVESALCQALEGALSAEAARRVEQCLQRWEATARRQRWALEALAMIDNSEARALLQRLAGGDSQAWLTQSAKAALERSVKASAR
jgi:hypothetical protein